MADDAGKGPHYIPDLDPENAKGGPGLRQPILWLLFLGGVAMSFAGAALLFNGVSDTGLVVLLVGLVMLAVLVPLGVG